MSEDTFKWQLSLKLGQGNAHMLNIRSDSAETFAVALDDLVKLADTIKTAARTFEPAASFPIPAPSFPIADVRATPSPAPVSTPPPAPVPQPSMIQEVGPVLVEKVEVTQGIGKNQKPYTRYVLNFSGGLKAATFDALMASVAQQLVGKMAYAKVSKGNFGYELESVRPA